MTHARFSPSSAHRWSVCHGSVVLQEQFPDQSSSYAREGSFAHDIAARCLTKGKSAFSYLRTKSDDGEFEVTEELARYVDEYTDFVESMLLLFGGEPLVETGVEYTDEIYGTADLILLSQDGRTLVVIDFKYGAGEAVEAKGNKQLMCYALGALKEIGPIRGGLIERIDMHIYQPRARSGPAWREASMTPEQLEAAGEDLARQVRLINAGSNSLVPGDHCKFCRAVTGCPARQAETQVAAKAAFEEVNPTVLDTQDLLKLHANSERVREFLDAVKTTLQQRAERGLPVPGYKLVQKLGNRAWKDDAEAESQLSMNGVDPFTERKLASPSQIEKRVAKLNRKVNLSALIERPVRGVDLVPESDKRPALPPSADFTPNP